MCIAAPSPWVVLFDSDSDTSKTETRCSFAIKGLQVLDPGIGSDGAHHSEHALAAPTVDSVVIMLREVVHFEQLVPAKRPAEL